MVKKCVLLSIVLFFCAVTAFAQSPVAMKREAYMEAFSGKVMVKKAKAAEWIAASKGMSLAQDDEIKTGKKSYANIAFDKKATTAVTMQEDSSMIVGQMTVEPITSTEITYLSLNSGSVLTKVAKLKNMESEFKIKTPTAVVGVRGTGFEVKVMQ